MDEKKFSLDDIFAILRESTVILSKKVTVVYEKDDVQEKQDMLLSEYIAMSVASELTNEHSRVIMSEKKSDVIAAMKKNYYDEVAYPEYEHFGILMKGGSRKTRRSRR